jgi:multicomponent Na+:H+ antiporter subunit G
MTGTDPLSIVATVVTIAGVLIFAIGAVGVLRLPDLYTRLSAVTVASGLGLTLLLIGLLLHFPSPGNAVKILLAIIIQLATAAVAGNAVARSGYLTGAPRTPLTWVDELATAGGPRRTDLNELVRADEAGEPTAHDD